MRWKRRLDGSSLASGALCAKDAPFGDLTGSSLIVCFFLLLGPEGGNGASCLGLSSDSNRSFAFLAALVERRAGRSSIVKIVFYVYGSFGRKEGRSKQHFERQRFLPRGHVLPPLYSSLL